MSNSNQVQEIQRVHYLYVLWHRFDIYGAHISNIVGVDIIFCVTINRCFMEMHEKDTWQ